MSVTDHLGLLAQSTTPSQRTAFSRNNLFPVKFLLTPWLSSYAAGNNVEVDESLFQDIEDLDLDEDDPDFDPIEMGSDED